MWVSKAYFQLIREAAAEFRAWHEQCMRDKDAIIHSQEARLAMLETERRELTEKMVAWKQAEQDRINRVPEAVESTWEPQDWQTILAVQSKQEQEKPDA